MSSKNGCMYVIFLCLCFTLTSCMVGPDFHEPEAPCLEGYTEKELPSKTASAPIKGGTAQHFAFGKEIPEEWWALFHSEELKELVAMGIANNPSLEAAEAALRQSQETMKAYVGTAFLPTVDGLASGERQRFSGSTFGIEQPPTTFSLYNVQVNVSYNLDVFGGARRKTESLCSQVENKYFLVEATYLSLTANIVTRAITEASLRGQIHATLELIALSEKQLQLVKQQFNLGAASKANVLAQETQLDQIKATLPPLEKNLSVTRHSLIALLGCFPGTSLLPNFYLKEMQLPKELPVSCPSELVRQRPDIRAAEATLHQASAEVGVSTANLYPQFSLTGSYGSAANSTAELFKNISNVWSYTGQILQPIFHGGSLQAQKRASIAAFDQAAAQYRQTVLQAFQNVADSLRAVEIDARALRIQTAAEKAAWDTLSLVQRQFKLGANNYLDLLNAEQQYQKAKLNRIQAQAARFSDTAALFQALGGGWWNCGSK